MNKHFNALVRFTLTLAMVLPAIIAPFLLAGTYSLPKAILLRFMLVLIAGGWLGKLVVSGRLTVDSIGVHPALILFVSVLVLTTVMSGSPVVSLFGSYHRHEGLLTWLAYIIIFIASASYIDEDGIGSRLKVSLVVALPIVMYAIAQFLGWDFFPHAAEADVSRVFSTLGNSVYLGTYLVLVIPVALGLFLYTQSKDRYLYAAVLILSALTLVLTYTRAAWLGAAVGGAFFIVVYAREFDRTSLRVVLGFFVVIVAIVGVLLIAKPEKSYVYPRLMASFDLSAGSVGERLGFWRTSLSVIGKRPLFGWGLETFGDVAWPYRPDVLNGRPTRADRPHNQLLYLASSVGLIGLAAYIWLLAAIFKQVWRGVRENEDAKDRILATAILAAGLGYLVQEQFSFSQVETAPLFWLLMGFGVVLGRPKPAFKQYDLSKRPSLLVVGAAVLSIGLAVLMVANVRFLAADYHYKKYLNGREGDSPVSSAVMLNPYENLYRNALGVRFLEIGQISKDEASLVRAASEFEKALLVNSRDKVIAANLAKTYSLLSETDGLFGQYIERAIEAHTRVLRIDPLFTRADRSLAILYMNSGKSDSALVHLRKWLSVEPDNGEALYYMGAVFDDQGKKAQAIKYYRRAAKVDTPFAKEATARLRSLTESRDN